MIMERMLEPTEFNTKSKHKLILTLTGVVGFFLAVVPVLDPYVFLQIGSGITIKVNDVLMLIIGTICFSRFQSSNLKTNYLCFLVVGLAMLSIFANIYNAKSFASSFKNLIIWFIYSLVLMYMWRTPCRDKFLYWAEIIALIAAAMILLQFMAGYIGLPMWDGRLPIGELGKYDQWSGYIDKNTGDIRPNGIFQEASYAGIYLSVTYVNALKNGRIKRAVVYALAMLSTTSMIAVVMCLLLTLYIVFAGKTQGISKSTKRSILFGVIIALVVLIYLINTNELAQQSLNYIIDRLNNVDSDLTGERMSSTRYRLSGYIYLFDRYSVIQKIFGVGVAQFSALFNVGSYSNVWVTTLLNSGFLGVAFLTFILLKLFKNIDPKNRAFLVIFVAIISSDFQWFSGYFFYLLTACILANGQRSGNLQDWAVCENRVQKEASL